MVSKLLLIIYIYTRSRIVLVKTWCAKCIAFVVKYNLDNHFIPQDRHTKLQTTISYGDPSLPQYLTIPIAVIHNLNEPFHLTRQTHKCRRPKYFIVTRVSNIILQYQSLLFIILQNHFISQDRHTKAADHNILLWPEFPTLFYNTNPCYSLSYRTISSHKTDIQRPRTTIFYCDLSFQHYLTIPMTVINYLT